MDYKFFFSNSISQGTSVRFNDFEYSPIPGPGNYKIEGFAEDLLKKNAKLVKGRKSFSPDEKTKSLEKKNTIDKIDETGDEYEN